MEQEGSAVFNNSD